MRNLIYSPFPNYKIKRPQKTFAFLKIGFCQIQLSIWETSYIQHRSHCFAALSTFVKKYIYACVRFLTVTSWHAHFWYVPLHDIFATLSSGIWQKVLMVQEVSSKPPAQWFSLICLLQHFPANEQFALLIWRYLCAKCWKNLLLAKWKISIRNSKNTYTKQVTVLWRLQMTSA